MNAPHRIEKSILKKPRFGQLQTTMYRKGYKWFDTGDFNLNLIGIRSNDLQANTFNDLFCVAYRVDNQPQLMCFEATTDPGTYWREHTANVEGTAIMVPAQYTGLWRIGYHQNKYHALVQANPVRVYRDNNRNEILDLVLSSVREGVFGINCHRATAQGQSRMIDKWSAGCQVLANVDDFNLLMALCHQAAARYGNSFTYTLLNEDDLWSL